MIHKIIHISDIHIPNSEEKRPYSEMLKNMLGAILDEIGETDPNEVRIVIVGDTFDQKIKATNEAKSMFHEMLNYLNEIAKTYIVAGNHDMLENNTDRMDSLNPTFDISGVYENIVYADKELGFKSGFIVDDNIVFVLYSMHDSFARPGDFDFMKKKVGDEKKIIGLYHGEICGAVTDTGNVSTTGIDFSYFEGCDCVMAGHIHKFQEIKQNGIPLVYSGSVFQKDAGENTTVHGFVSWDIDTMTYKHCEVANDYKIYKFEMTDYEDVTNDTEKLLNL